jgi:uncharacterized BrkB/YihY/UPF0761 family membrane protein
MTFISHLVAADIWFFILWMLAIIGMVCFVYSQKDKKDEKTTDSFSPDRVRHNKPRGL